MSDREEMQNLEEIKAPRKQIVIRLLYTILYFIVFEILKIVIEATTVFQFVYLLATGKYSQPLRSFSNKVATYAYQVIRYLTLNANYRPFPFHDFPAETEPPEDPVHFD